MKKIRDNWTYLFGQSGEVGVSRRTFLPNENKELSVEQKISDVNRAMKFVLVALKGKKIKDTHEERIYKLGYHLLKEERMSDGGFRIYVGRYIKKSFFKNFWKK